MTDRLYKELYLHARFTLPCVVRPCHWLSHTVIYFSPRKHGFNSRLFHVGFVVKKVVLRHASFRVIPSSPFSIIPPRLQAHQFLSQMLNSLNSSRRPQKTRFIMVFCYCTYFTFVFCLIRISHSALKFFIFLFRGFTQVLSNQFLGIR